MVLFGRDQLYASHIPMFTAPHDWQALFQVEIAHASQDAKATYVASAFHEGKQQLVTIKPSPFVLTQLLTGGINSFRGTVFNGSFEDGGAPILTQVTVTVTKVLKRSQLMATTPALPQLTYEGLGMGDYLVHPISAPKNFDQIVQVAWKNSGSTMPQPILPEEPVTFATQDSHEVRLKSGQEFSLVRLGTGWRAVEVSTSPGVGANQELGFTVQSDFYCTPGPDFFGNCSDE